MKRITIVLFLMCLMLTPKLEAKNNADEKKKQEEKDLLVTATPENYKDVTSSGIVFVDFWAAWCGPCRRMNPILKDVAEERVGQVTIAKLNVDEHNEFTNSMRVSNLPTIIIYKDGKEITRAQGLIPKEKLLEVVDYLSSVKE